MLGSKVKYRPHSQVWCRKNFPFHGMEQWREHRNTTRNACLLVSLGSPTLGASKTQTTSYPTTKRSTESFYRWKAQDPPGQGFSQAAVKKLEWAAAVSLESLTWGHSLPSSLNIAARSSSWWAVVLRSFSLAGCWLEATFSPSPSGFLHRASPNMAACFIKVSKCQELERVSAR